MILGLPCCLCETLRSRLGLPTDSLWNLKWGVHGGLLLRPPTCIMTPQKKYMRTAWKKPRNVSELGVLAQVYKSYLLRNGGSNPHSEILPEKGMRKEKQRQDTC